MLPRDIDNKADTSRGNLNIDCLGTKKTAQGRFSII